MKNVVEFNTKVLFGHDKLMHFELFAIVSFCVSLLIVTLTCKKFRLRGLAIIWFTLSLIGIAEEYRQFILPNRTAELWDAVANLLGVCTGMLLPYLFSLNKEALPVARYFLFFLMILFPLLLGLVEINERHFIIKN